MYNIKIPIIITNSAKYTRHNSSGSGPYLCNSFNNSPPPT